mgnify:CR=1 FL=1
MASATTIFIPGLLCTEYLFHHQRDAMPGSAVFADTRQHDTMTAMAETFRNMNLKVLMPENF